MPGVRELARAEIVALDLPLPRSRDAGLWLDANESWEDSEGRARGRNRYPGPLEEVAARLAPRYGVDAARICLTRGSDDGIDALTRVFCRAGVDAVQVTPPTFHMYAHSARIQGASVVATPRDPEDFSLDVGRVLADWRPAVKLLYLCTPNNPSGSEIPAADILDLCRALTGKSLVVVDEAYAEFSASPGMAAYIATQPNLAVLRTLSKAWALAGERCGLLLADPEVIALVRQVLPPYPLATSSLEAAAASLAPAVEQMMAARVRQLVSERNRVATALAAVPAVLRVYPSAANFLLVRCSAAASMQQQLLEVGVRVRGFKEPGLADCLRITIGNGADNDRLLAALHQEERRRA